MGRNNREFSKNSQSEILKLPYLVLVVSLLFTIGATYIFYKNEKSKDLSRFRNDIDRCKSRIDSRLRAYVGLLKAGRGFVEANDRLTGKMFSGFMDSLEIKKNYPEVNQIGFSKKLTEKMRSEGHADFKIFPTSDNSEFQPIIFIEPDNNRNLSEVGFDMLSNPIYQAAMDRAILTGETTATGKLSLTKQNEKKITGFIIFMPVYQGGETPDTQEKRKELLEGFIYNSINADIFLEDAQKYTGVSDLAVAFYENEPLADNLVARIPENFLFDGKSLNLTNEAGLADRKLTFGYQALPSFDNQSGINRTPLFFLTGMVFSLLLFGITYLESYARAKAERISGELKESEKEKGFLLEREQKARQTAEDSNRVKDEFISIVSHELRTPLNSIAGWSKILHSEHLPEDTKLKALQSIEKNIRIQTGIVEDLLNLSQIISGTRHLDKKDTDISQIFEESFLKAEEKAKNKKITLVKENNLGAGQNIQGDGEQLKRVFKNLFSNAIKFTPEDGKIFAGLSKKDGFVEIKIADTGKGIKPEFLSGIFENFMQADSSITRSHGGLGLGLALVRRIIELHNGTISVHSEGENKGTEFIIRLPDTKHL